MIHPGDKRLAYTGRVDWSDPERPAFVYPCTSVALRFTGGRVTLHLENQGFYWENYVGCILDSRQSAFRLPRRGALSLELDADPAQGREHDLLLFKRQDACHILHFLGAELEPGGALLEPPERPSRRIEVYGDSVSAGEVSEAVDYAGRRDPEHNGEYSNSWYSYAWMTARRLNAELHDIAQGGIALMDGTGWFHEPDAIGMESVWDTVRYSPQAGGRRAWDFSRYTPQAVIVAIGQNDSHPEDYMSAAPDSPRAALWRERYQAFLMRLRGVYPDARIVCCTTLLEHGAAWDDAIGKAVCALGDDRVTQYRFRRNGAATPGHLRIPEAEEMAIELAAYLESLSIAGW